MNNPYLIDRAMPGGVPVSAVLPPDYNPANINPYAPGSKLNQGMFQPQQSMYNPYQGMFSPYSGGLNFPSQFGGVSYPQFNMFNPYSQGMFSGFGMQAPQQQADPYALPTQPFQNPFGGYTDYTGVNQDFINARRSLIDALASKAGMSIDQAVRAADNSTILNSIVTGVGGRRYGENSPTVDANPSSTSSTSTGGFI